MKSALKENRRYFHLIVGLLTLNLLLAGAGGLARVWLHQQISETAKSTDQIRREIEKTELRLNYLDTKIAALESPGYLRRRVAQLGLDLRPPMPEQIVYLSPVQRSLPPVEPESVPGRRSEPFVQSFDLAVMEPLGGGKSN